MKRTSLLQIGLVGLGLIALLAACSTPSSTLPQPQDTTLQTPTGEITLDQLGKMTPEQIEQLNQGQLEAVNKKLDDEFAASEAEFRSDALVATATGYCGSYTGALWPNAAHTLKCAVNIGADNYVSSVRSKFSGPNWTSDGCSNVPDYVFLNACRHHDFAYRNLPKYGQFRTTATRLKADQKFYSNMVARCEARFSRFNPSRYVCKGVAYTYYVGARNLGISSYYGTTKLFP